MEFHLRIKQITRKEEDLWLFMKTRRMFPPGLFRPTRLPTWQQQAGKRTKSNFRTFSVTFPRAVQVMHSMFSTRWFGLHLNGKLLHRKINSGHVMRQRNRYAILIDLGSNTRERHVPCGWRNKNIVTLLYETQESMSCQCTFIAPNHETTKR